MDDKSFLRFDFVDERDQPNPVCFSNPERILTARSASEVTSVLRGSEQALRDGKYVAGFVSYEAALAFDPCFKALSGGDLPLAWFGIFPGPNRHVGSACNRAFSVSPWEPETFRADYCRRIAILREAIRRGETYQVNTTTRLHARFSGSAEGYYQVIRNTQRGNYAAYLDIGRFQIVSASPELFFRLQGQTLTTRPMKGTAPRGLAATDDMEVGRDLVRSPKNRAENATIVDLLRNDMSQVSVAGSVQVEELFRLEQYPTLWQLTSTISSQLERECSLLDLFTALFPCGSVTGAPKISTMKLISETEDSPRHIYCGAIGYATPHGHAVFNVAIRTVLIDLQRQTATYGTGGGITWDSSADDEYDEMITKASVLTARLPKFELLETMLLENGSFSQLSEHLNRMEGSARYFDFCYNKADAQKALTSIANARPLGRFRVRLLLQESGKLRTQDFPLPEENKHPRSVVLARNPVFSADRFLYHKTTHRDVYEQIKKEAPEAYDVLLWNECGQLTEFTTGNLLVLIDGKMITPPQKCGLLAGVYREMLLKSGIAQESVLCKDDLQRCEGIWLINSVRGKVPVILQGAS